MVLDQFNSSYQMCHKCDKPLVNENNLQILRRKWIKWGVLGVSITAAGAATGAYVLPFLGFGDGGVTAASFAANWQGPAVAAGSVFSICQSLGATGLGTLMFGTVGTVAGGAGALGLIYKYRDKFDWCSCD